MSILALRKIFQPSRDSFLNLWHLEKFLPQLWFFSRRCSCSCSWLTLRKIFQPGCDSFLNPLTLRKISAPRLDLRLMTKKLQPKICFLWLQLYDFTIDDSPVVNPKFIFPGCDFTTLQLTTNLWFFSRLGNSWVHGGYFNNWILYLRLMPHQSQPKIYFLWLQFYDFTTDDKFVILF